MKKSRRPFLLAILDGWGYSDNPKDNAIAAAHTPYWDELWATYPHTLITGSGTAVGLPQEQMGNSEVGHLNIGAGRVVYQDLTRIDEAIERGDFFKNPVLQQAIQETKSTHKALHILGLLSPGGVHSHEHHIHALIQYAAQQGLKKIYLHAFLDGRDTPPKSAMASLEKCHELLKNQGQIASITGRYYAMDRDKRWDRIEAAYRCLTTPIDAHAKSAMAALTQAYERGETDEFVPPTQIYQTSPITIEDGDSVIFMNFRADRARQLTQALVEPHFGEFKRDAYPQSHVTTLTQYAAQLPTAAAFPPVSLDNVLGEYLGKLDLPQLRVAETEKYAHVTYFFNGGKEMPFPGEDRLLIPSPKVATYDLKPEMRANEITDAIIKALHEQKYHLIITNFANPDMVGHTGNLKATIKAIETVDHCLARLIPVLQQYDGEALITADHGNAEMMFNEETQQPHTAHTTALVPLLYIGKKHQFCETPGKLSDVAPTLLHLMGLTPPAEMTGKCLLMP